MKTFLKITILMILMIFSLESFGQNTCSEYLKFRKPENGFAISPLTKSGRCTGGKKYNFTFSLDAGKYYRFSFHAAAVFDNQMKFKIFNKTENKVVLEANGETALRETIIENQTVRPYFEFLPTFPTVLEITIDVLPSDMRKSISGCVGIFVQEKILSHDEKLENKN